MYSPLDISSLHEVTAMPPHRAQECLGVPVGFERWMYLTLISFDWICDCYRDLGMAFSHLLRYIHLPQLDNMDFSAFRPLAPQPQLVRCMVESRRFPCSAWCFRCFVGLFVLDEV